MPSPNQKLAESLEVLADLLKEGARILESSSISRTHRDRLKRAGFVTPVIKGWWMATDPAARPGDTTAWTASFWEFCARYFTSRFGREWHLSPEISLLLHADATGIPRQIVVHALRGANNAIDLPFGTSLFDYAIDALPSPQFVVERHGLRALSVSIALVRASPSFFERHPIEAQVALTAVPDASDLLVHLLEGDHTVIAGRIAGALRRIGRGGMADEIAETMSRAGYRVRERDPFVTEGHLPEIRRRTPAIVARLRGLWAAMRDEIVERLPEPSMTRRSPRSYLELVDAVYDRDAYHSLSIEGYRVTTDLIERVRMGEWDPEGNPGDREGRDALAARGYWLAFQRVKGEIEMILRDPGSAGSIVRDGHRAWYRDLFQPAVNAGLLDAADLAGYRTGPIYIQGSRHVPPRPDAVRDAMAAPFDLIEEEEDARVRAVLGHWMLGYVHPFPDGNGRVARFLMNTMLASGGYPWTVIRLEEREAYMTALERASVDQEIGPFAELVVRAVRRAEEEFG